MISVLFLLFTTLYWKKEKFLSFLYVYHLAFFFIYYYFIEKFGGDLLAYEKLSGDLNLKL